MASPTATDTQPTGHTGHTGADDTATPSARARRRLGLPDPVARSEGRAAADRALQRLGGPVGLAAAATPTIAFVAADAAAGLGTAFVALAVTAVLACAVRLARRESPGAAVAGLVIAAVCATVAALAGEARAFFLPTMLLPAAFVLAYVVSLLARRPLMGLMVNPLAGGPRDWHGHRALRTTYTVSTAIGLTLATANLLARVALYLDDQPAALAAIQVGLPAVFAVHFAVTVLAARRAAGTGTTTTAVAAPSPVPDRT